MTESTGLKHVDYSLTLRLPKLIQTQSLHLSEPVSSCIIREHIFSSSDSIELL